MGSVDQGLVKKMNSKEQGVLSVSGGTEGQSLRFIRETVNSGIRKIGGTEG